MRFGRLHNLTITFIRYHHCVKYTWCFQLHLTTCLNHLYLLMYNFQFYQVRAGPAIPPPHCLLAHHATNSKYTSGATECRAERERGDSDALVDSVMAGCGRPSHRDTEQCRHKLISNGPGSGFTFEKCITKPSPNGDGRHEIAASRR